MDPRSAVLGIAGASPRTCTVEGTRLRYHVAGEPGAPPVVLLHGGGLDAAAVSWKHAVPALARRLRVYAPDWPGYGDSDAPDERPDLAYYRDVLGGFLDELGIGRAALAGISLGGGVALAFALDSPERVRSLALVSSDGLGGATVGIGTLAGGVGVLNAATWAAIRRSRSLVAAGVRAATVEPPPGLIDEVWALARRPDAGRAWQRFQRAELRSDGGRSELPSRLPALAVPTLFLHGRRDRLVPVRWAERAAERVPDARLRTLDCGHWVPRERPQETNGTLLAFFEDVDRHEQ